MKTPRRCCCRYVLKGDTSRIKANGHRLFVNGKQIKVD